MAGGSESLQVQQVESWHSTHKCVSAGLLPDIRKKYTKQAAICQVKIV